MVEPSCKLCYGFDMNIEEVKGVLLLPEYEEAFLGCVENFDGDVVAAYDREKVIGINMEKDGMDRGDAIEFFYYNQMGAYMENRKPIFIDTRFTQEEILEYHNGC